MLGLYTHVYLTLECAIILGLVFFWLLFKDRKKLIPFCIVSGVVILLYIPWLLVLLYQAARAAKGFWIPSPLSPKILWGILYIPFQHEFDSSLSPVLLNIICLVTGALSMLGIINAVKNRKTTGLLTFLCLTTSVLTFTGAFLLSLLIRPILLPRYLISLMGLYIILWMYGILFLKKPLFKIIAVAAVLGLFVPQIIDIKTIQRNGPMAEVRTYLQDKVHRDDVFLHSDEHQFGIFCYYYPYNFHYLLLPDKMNEFTNYEPFKPNGLYGHDYRKFLEGRSHVKFQILYGILRSHGQETKCLH